MSKTRKLLLWDIDQTLISTSNAGKRALARVLREVHGVESALDEVDLRGSSDWRIVRELLVHHHLPDRPETIALFFASYYQILAEELPKGKVTLHPGIDSILETIHRRNDLAQGLLTGNMRRGAQLKLEHAGIWKYFPFGAFGDDSADRNELGPFALRRAQQIHGINFDPEDVFIIGDTPHDIACARAIGAKAVAIATGGHSVAELKLHQPDALFVNLQEPAAFLGFIDQ